MSENMWMVRAGRNAILVDDFEEKKYVAIGWLHENDLSVIKTKEKLINLYDSFSNNVKPGKRRNSIGQILRFLFDFKISDYILTYNNEYRYYLVGRIVGEYKYDRSNDEYYRHIRKVEWQGKVNRDDLSVSTKNSLGAIQTIFSIKDKAKNEMLSLLKGEKPESKEVSDDMEIEDLEYFRKDIQEKAFEFIKDKILELDWEEMEDLAAGILRAMGYKTRMTSAGSDRGIDIIASPDGLGLEQPRIKVEVKHRKDSMRAEAIRSFISVLRIGDNGLYISTGGFTKDARYEAERSTIPVTILDIDDLTILLLDNYDNIDNDTKALIPLAKLYWPL